jgi:hypothetical protein
MSRFARFIALAALPVLLAACGALIPDQSVDDLYGFNNVTVDLTVGPAPSGSVLAPQASEIVAAGSISREIDPDVLADLPFDPTNVRESVRPQWIRLVRPAGGGLLAPQTIFDELPETLSLDEASFAVSFSDGVTTFNKTVSVPFSPSAQFVRDDASCTTQRCDYLPVDVEAASLTVELSGAEIVEMLQILGSAATPKIASGEAQLFFSQDPLLANVTTARLRVETFDGVIGFR